MWPHCKTCKMPWKEWGKPECRCHERIDATFAAIVDASDNGREFTDEEIEGYFLKAQEPNPAVDEILAHTPATWDELRDSQNSPTNPTQ